MTNQQMELSLSAELVNRAPRRESRANRAAWWFGQMRELVNNAIDWEAAPEARPEQGWLGISHRRQSA